MSINFRIFGDLHYIDKIPNWTEKNTPEIVDYSEVINALRLKNRTIKEKIMKTPNILGNNIYNLLDDLDNQYKELSIDYKDAIKKERQKSKDNTKKIILSK